MNRLPRILPAVAFFFSSAIVWLIAVEAQAQPANSAGSKPAEGNMTDYMLSYLVVILGIVLGLLVVAKTSNRRDRERPAGYVEKNFGAEE